MNAGQEIGPDGYRCGPVVDGAEPGWPSAVSVLAPRAGRNVVERLAADGVDCIETYNHVDRATFEAMSEVAARRNIPMIGHVPHAVGLVRSRSFEAHHLTGLPYVHREPLWSSDVESADLAGMTDIEVAEALAIAAARRVSLVPTPQRFPPTEAARLFPSSGALCGPRSWDARRGHKRSMLS